MQLSTVAGLSTLMLLASAGIAPAGGFGEEAHADSFGNLVIHSPAGYKRVIVGRGHLAGGEPVDAARGAPGPYVVHLDEAYEDGAVAYGCDRHGVLLHGRSYMYGIDRNVTPVLVGPCR